MNRLLVTSVLALALTGCGDVASHVAPSQDELIPGGLPVRNPLTGDELPADMPGIPWSDYWYDVRVSGDGGAASLVGFESRTFELMRASKYSLPIYVRDGSSETLALVGPAARVIDLSYGAAGRRIGATVESTNANREGSWSHDGRRFALISGQRLMIFDRMEGTWTERFRPERWRLSGPACSPVADEVAIVEAAQVESKYWSDVSARYPGGDGPPRGQLEVIGFAGDVRRTIRLDHLAQRVNTLGLGWSPDGRWLVLATWSSGWPSADDDGVDVFVFDAASLAQVDSRHKAKWGLAGEQFLPQWNATSDRVLLCAYGPHVLDVDSSGHFAECWDVAGVPWALRACWAPSGSRMLIFTKREAPDVQEIIETVLGAGEARTHRNQYSAWFCDVTSRVPAEIVEARHVGREEWHDPWMIPRVAEAFALWTR